LEMMIDWLTGAVVTIDDGFESTCFLAVGVGAIDDCSELV
jgi:hypothetical protein